MTPRAVWQLAVAAALLVLLATLATVQYRWLGDVSDAERERLRASLRARSTEFTDDMDREISNLFATFHVAGEPFDRDPAGTLADAYARALRPGSSQSLVKAVYVAAISGGRNWSVQQLDLAHRTLKPADPASALPFLHRSGPPPPAGAHPLLLADSIDALTPALIVGIPTLKTVGDSTRYSMLPEPDALFRLVVVVLDEKALRAQLVEPFAAAHFGSGASAEYVLTIVRGANPAQIVYSSDSGSPVDEKSADVAMPVFTLRPDAMKSAASALAATGRKEQVSVTIVRRADGLNGTNIVTSSDIVGAWRLLIRGKSGSLDALVARSRRRNLAISLGILGLLAASFVLIIASAQRQHRLARQQMEFVAAVSHELRTPVAVICSAGENLADGVVADREQVKTYGALVQTEGRRLADMVERVMEFAGIASGARRAHTEIDLTRVLAEACGAVDADARQRAIAVRSHAAAVPALFVGDGGALRSAFQNVIANAVKYSRAGGTIDIDLTADESAIRLRVVDHGIGIDRDELSKIFKPFFRGRRALDAQIRGTGVGLSVVRHIVDAHGGTIQVDSDPGEGTTVTIAFRKHEAKHLVAHEAHQVS